MLVHQDHQYQAGGSSVENVHHQLLPIAAMHGINAQRAESIKYRVAMQRFAGYCRFLNKLRVEREPSNNIRPSPKQTNYHSVIL